MVDTVTEPLAKKRRTCSVPTKCQFTDFILVKSYDIISENQYRKYLVGCKENGDAWAINLQLSMSVLVASIKSVQTAVESISSQSNPKLKKICVEVMSMADAPLSKLSTWGICHITGIRSEGCIEIGSNLNKSSMPRSKNRQLAKGDAQKTRLVTVIHPKFGHFMLMLWYSSRMEHILRNYTRYWITEMNKEHSNIQLGEMCTLFADKTKFFDELYKVYVEALQHVIGSIRAHNDNT
jgi:hypothetical protein